MTFCLFWDLDTRCGSYVCRTVIAINRLSMMHVLKHEPHELCDDLPFILFIHWCPPNRVPHRSRKANGRVHLYSTNRRVRAEEAGRGSRDVMTSCRGGGMAEDCARYCGIIALDVTSLIEFVRYMVLCSLPLFAQLVWGVLSLSAKVMVPQNVVLRGCAQSVDIPSSSLLTTWPIFIRTYRWNST